ncbi:methylated-DNA--[protein]-cysteine S-methyltransferase [Tissierella creatinophila]|uniref:Methylated-DNA--protein-cysteine methyltransferase n=1 Tax=Tissierella creatinophila DSM 6911 TaxID=1123403 RepID=A0A1U7M8N2_TISCR|nr:methylated-DNA--[protein]-cysteine S-methyltransferase [Tissierella creatinophila]OLS03645.1 methylated-DNA--protein-cysteine methyltransferase [Tissierella creatinophila DSM 6911]
MKNLYFYDTILGVVGIIDDESSIIEVFYGKEEREGCYVYESPLIKETYRQLKLYLEGQLKKIDVPIHFEGTEFQVKVWKALMDIPYGETRSYKDIAKKVESPKAYRAVGMTNNKNPISIIVPCHRVIGANGKLIGYGGGIDIKKKLLDIEKSNLDL